MTKKQIYRFLHFLPLVAILGIITLIWYDSIVIILLILFLPVTAILIASTVFAIIYGIKSGGAHAKAIIAMCAIDFIALVLLVIIGTRDDYGCDVSRMNKHYQENKEKLEDLTHYVKSALNKDTHIYLEFEGRRVSIFHVDTSSHWDVSNSIRLLQMNRAGLDEDEFKTIRKKLKDVDCISVETFDDYCDIGYKRVYFGKYDFRIFSRDLTDEEKKYYLGNLEFIPLNRRVIFKYSGGAIGAQTFGSDYREQYLKENPPDW